MHKEQNKTAKKKQFKKKKAKTEEEQENNPDFYLDDADADIAYNSDELKDDDEDEGEGINEEEMSEHGSDLDFNEEDYASSHDNDEEGQGEGGKKKKETVMTKSELKKLIKKANQGSLYSLTQVVILFGKITNSDNQPETLSSENIFTNSKIINKFIEYCIDTLPNHLQLKLSTKREEDTHKSGNKSSIKELSKKYISIISKYLKTCGNQMKEFIFRHLSSFETLIFLYNSYIEKFLKLAINIWASHSSSSTREDSLTFIRSAVTQKPTFFEYAIKLFYINYLEIAKAMNLNSHRIINLLQQDIISILKLDIQKTYITLFVFIRKLCIQLRATITDKTSSSIKHIYNWQFVNSLLLWTKVVIKYYKSDSDINMLAYPLVQTIIGVIRLNYSETFYLLRLRLVCALNDISKASGIFIPIGIYILPILSSNYFIEKIKGGKDTKKMKRLNPFTNLKIKIEDYKIKQVRKDLLEEVCDCLIDFLSVNSSKICFNDLVNVILKQMRMVLKKIYDKEYREILKKTIEMIETNIVYIQNQISMTKDSINIIHPETISKFENGLLHKDSKCELAKEYAKNQRKRTANLEAIEHQQDDKFIEV